MKRAVPIALWLLVAGAHAAAGQAGGIYALERTTLSAGGVTFATGGVYRLGATIGQPAAASLAGGAYALRGGFWTPDLGGTIATPVLDPVPLAYAARTAAPNPFRTTTRIEYDLPESRRVELAIYDVDGRLVRQLVHGERPAGTHRAFWDGRDQGGRSVASGVYFVRLAAGDFEFTDRVVRLD